MPPPFPSTFPFCDCNRTNAITPFSMGYTPVVSTSSLGLMYSWTIVYKTNPANGICASSTSVSKIEIYAGSACKQSLLKTFVNNRSVPFDWDARFGVLRVTGLNVAPGAAATEPGVVRYAYVGHFGILLSSSGACSTLREFCHDVDYCQYALFDESHKCCPTGVVGGGAAP